MRALLIMSGALLALIAVTAEAGSEAHLTLQGRLVGSDGKPLKVAVVQWEPHALTPVNVVRPRGARDPRATVHPHPRTGRYTLQVPAAGAYRIWFSAPGHTSLSVSVVLEETAKRRRNLPKLDARLSASPKVDWFGTPAIFVKGTKAADVIRMEQAEGGLWRAEVPGTAAAEGTEAIDYLLVLETKDGQVWFPNPGGADTVFDRQFFSRAQPSDGVAVVRFDPALLPSNPKPAAASFKFADEQDPVARIARLAEGASEASAEVLDLIKAAPETERGERLKEAWTKTAEAPLAVWRDRKAPQPVRQVAAVAALSGLVMLPDTDPKLLDAVIDSVPATAWAWSLHPPAYGGRIRVRSGTDGKAPRLIETMSDRHPDPIVRAQALYARAKLAEQEERLDEYEVLIRRLSRDYTDQREVRALLQRETRKRQRGEGAEPMPLALTTLEGKPINSETLKGRWTLLDFSTSGCGACVSVIPELVKIREAHPETLLRMVTVTLHVDAPTLKELLARQPPQPWEHAALPDDDDTNARMKDWEIWHYPTFFLIDPEGKIAAVDETLRKGSFPDNVARVIGERTPKAHSDPQ